MKTTTSEAGRISLNGASEEISFVDFSEVVSEVIEDFSAGLAETVSSGMFIGGKVLEGFESTYAAFHEKRFAIGVGNGLDALRLSLESWGIGPGDEVIVPAFSFFASWLAVVQTGATLVPVDVKPDDGTIDEDQIEQAVSERTRAIVAVHLYGNPCEMGKIKRIAQNAGLKLLEDTAQAHGLKIGNQLAGAIGDAGAFSFYPTKNLGALGDGGIILTDDPALAKELRSRRSYGYGNTKYDFETFGVNSRLDPIQAAYLNRQLPKLEARNFFRQSTVAAYREALRPELGKIIGPKDTKDSVWHVASVNTSRRKELKAHFNASGIQTDAHYPYWVGSLSILKEKIHWVAPPEKFAVSKAFSENVVSIPLGHWQTEKQIRAICAALRSFKPSGNDFGH